MFCEETYREFAEAVKNGKVGIAELESRLTRSDDPAQISKTLEAESFFAPLIKMFS